MDFSVAGRYVARDLPLLYTRDEAVRCFNCGAPRCDFLERENRGLCQNPDCHMVVAGTFAGHASSLRNAIRTRIRARVGQRCAVNLKFVMHGISVGAFLQLFGGQGGVVLPEVKQGMRGGASVVHKQGLMFNDVRFIGRFLDFGSVSSSSKVRCW